MLERLRCDTPLGAAMALLTEGSVCALAFEESWPPLEARVAARFGTPRVCDGSSTALPRALDAYFAGVLPALDAISLELRGTAFQERVWRAVRAIPPGETSSYGALAESLGCPKASRAVGAANGSNPALLIVPCHRVVGAAGAMVGYAGGLERKRRLLAHEAHWATKFRSAPSAG